MIQLFPKTTSSTEDVKIVTVPNDIDKFKAALALNFCTVSVSQIVDYDDLYVLEQEYEGILNNLNLKAFPKDDALLEILRKILDTITFFRIQEGDKKFIERDYQQKMKNAIWSSAPNLVAVLATGNPVAMAVTLASQIGIGYMNYRKAKAQNALEYEKEKWQLQRTAIDQFNALRRELFTTAWRLARDYDFPDEYRLTESQISQYNSILMDADPLRRYERLSSIQEEFVAYPPFWYYLGNAEYEVAKEYEARSTTTQNARSIADTFKKQALEHFKAFKRKNDNDLLRNNPIAAACHLEHIEVLFLDLKHNREEIKELLDLTVKKAGNSLDIIQICALDYLKIGEIQLAEKYLMKCVVENNNAVTNAQILSIIYANQLTENSSQSARIDYLKLERFVGNTYLFPLPDDNNQSSFDEQNQSFINKQKEILELKYELVAQKVLDKYSILLKRDLQTPTSRRDYPDSYYSKENTDIRINDIKKICASKAKDEYLGRLEQFDIDTTIISYCADFLKALSPVFKQEGMKDAIEHAEKYCKQITNKYKFDKNWEETPHEEFIEEVCKISLEDIIDPYIQDIFKPTIHYICSNNANTINDIASFEGFLVDVCSHQMIDSPAELYRKEFLKEQCSPNTTPDILFSFGDEKSIERQKREDTKRSMNEAIKDSIQKGLIIKGRFIFEDDHSGMTSYFSIHHKRIPNEIMNARKDKDIVAVFTVGNNKTAKKDLIFTTHSLYSFHTKKNSRYEELSISLDGKSIVNDKLKDFYEYYKIINISTFNDLLIELRKISLW